MPLMYAVHLAVAHRRHLPEHLRVRFAADLYLLLDGDKGELGLHGGHRQPAYRHHEHRGDDPRHTRGAGAAGTSSGRRLRRRAWAAVNSTPYMRITDDMYTHSRNTTTAATDP